MNNITHTYKLSYADYYPFGMKMPGKFGGGSYRYAYQGQEKDEETGFEAFELRQWDGRIGRWMSTDPYGQYASPYLGMGNNPVNRIDPDGGLDGPGDPPNNGESLWGNLSNLFSSWFDWNLNGLFSGSNIKDDTYNRVLNNEIEAMDYVNTMEKTTKTINALSRVKPYISINFGKSTNETLNANPIGLAGAVIITGDGMYLSGGADASFSLPGIYTNTSVGLSFGLYSGGMDGYSYGFGAGSIIGVETSSSLFTNNRSSSIGISISNTPGYVGANVMYTHKFSSW